jgi:hypothetical protein
VLADVYWHTRRLRWSVRVSGRVVDHLPLVALSGCRMVVREGERQRCLERGQRSVHAWVRGSLAEPPEAIPETFVEVGYNPFLAPHFTTRPGFEPIHAAAFVAFLPDGSAWALVQGTQQLETAPCPGTPDTPWPTTGAPRRR